jgi:hypothetical protein
MAPPLHSMKEFTWFGHILINSKRQGNYVIYSRALNFFEKNLTKIHKTLILSAACHRFMVLVQMLLPKPATCWRLS